VADRPVPWPPSSADTPLAVLASGGLDSAVLLGEAVRAYPRVCPLYVRTGAVWEAVEFLHLQRFLAALASPRLAPVVTLHMPVADVYGSHWSLSGDGVPDGSTPDEAVYLPGRNVILLAKAVIWCHLNGVPEVATAPLGSNPFPDATDEFYDGFAGVVSRAVGGRVRVLRPYAAMGLHKREVLRRGIGMPLAHTFSCIRPAGERHCGRCNKCAERKAGFADAGVDDPTEYAS
jgi:7-cyano-7-deazaguanine synthase